MSIEKCDGCGEAITAEANAQGWPIPRLADGTSIGPCCYGEAWCPEGHVLDAHSEDATCAVCEGTTKYNISFATISALRHASYEHGDDFMGAVCDLALDGQIDTDDYGTLDRAALIRLGDMSRDEAYAACAAAVNELVGDDAAPQPGCSCIWCAWPQVAS